jgi:hypothetical protein
MRRASFGAVVSARKLPTLEDLDALPLDVKSFWS